MIIFNSTGDFDDIKTPPINITTDEILFNDIIYYNYEQDIKIIKTDFYSEL